MKISHFRRKVSNEGITEKFEEIGEKVSSGKKFYSLLIKGNLCIFISFHAVCPPFIFYFMIPCIFSERRKYFKVSG